MDTPFEVRQEFYAQVQDFVESQRTHGPVIVLGDFNARLHYRQNGEEDVMGPTVFGNPNKILASTSNRELLVELCRSLDAYLANTFSGRAPEQLATYRDIGAPALAATTYEHFAQLDHVVVPCMWQSGITDVRVERDALLQSHHYMVAVDLDVQIPKRPSTARNKMDIGSLGDEVMASRFNAVFLKSLGSYPDRNVSIEAKATAISSAMGEAAKVLPQLEVSAKRPWISSKTLALIERRNGARRAGLQQQCSDLSKQVKYSAKEDRRKWLDDNLAKGGWQAIRRLRAGRSQKPGRLRDKEGNLVSSERRAETLADYLEHVQWQIMFAQEAPSSCKSLGPELPIRTDLFKIWDLQKVVKRMKSGKSTGGDQIHAEFWKVLAGHDGAMEELLSLCNMCWSDKSMPEAWKHSTVVTLFKKGDTSLPSNYRPISLLCVAYKVIASLLLDRLKAGGTERRIHQSQYGFRPGRGTTDALFLARRIIDAANEDRDGALYVLLLDWSKAFDRIKPKSLLQALERFGLPKAILDMIDAIYSSRQFNVRDNGSTSSSHPQAAGIAQGCPLSPYLFIITMTVLLADVGEYRIDSISATATPTPAYLVTKDIVYADDTMILGSSAAEVQRTLHAFAVVGRQYGLELNMDKTVLLRTGSDDDVFGEDGKRVQVKASASYLGSMLCINGRPQTELTRRLGEASRLFKSLSMVWKHANISQHRKLEIFDACVTSRLLYSLESAWFLKADQDKLDGFYTRCLRAICGIKPSFISRVSNKSVLALASRKPISRQLLRQQLLLYGKIARMDHGTYIRQVLFDGSLNIRRWHGRRRVGRPRLQWSSCVHAHAVAAAGNNELKLKALLASTREDSWNRTVLEYLDKY